MTTTTTRPGGYGARLTGDARAKLAEDVAKRYTAGASIRTIAEETGQSYGFIHRMLVTETEVEMRTRGGRKAEPEDKA